MRPRPKKEFLLAILLAVVILVPPPLALPGAAGHPVRARKGMVVSSHYLASQVGVDVLKKGGNAVDAAIAVGYALAVTHPGAGNIGGGGFLIARMASGEARTFNFREKAPAAAHPRMFLNQKGEYDEEKHHNSWLSVGVPGTVAGFALAHERLGKLPMRELIAPAIKLAEEGFPLSWDMADDFRDAAPRFRNYPASAKQFLKGDGFYEPDEIWKQPDLARTLRRIAERGRDGFYKGETARLLAAAMKENGGMISEADMAAYQAQELPPLRGAYRGYEILAMPPPSSGGAALITMLNILEGYDLREMGYGSAAHLHLMAEAMRRAFVDRNTHLGDPAFVRMPLNRLLSKQYAAELRGQIDPAHASATPAFGSSPGEGDHTTHYSVVDAAGNAVSVTTTINSGYGNAVTVTGAGFLLNNEMDDFAAAPGKPNQYGLVQGEANAVEPGKRMLSAMTPSIVLDPRGRVLMVVGTPGGPTIITSVTQVILNVIDHHMSLADAVGAPRIHHQALPDQIYYERRGLLPTTASALQAMGHTVDQRGGYSGDIAAILRQGTGWIGVADPRRGGGAVGF